MQQKASSNNFGIQETIKHTRWLFSILGIWFLISENSPTFREKICSVIIMILCQTIYLSVLIPGLHYCLLSNENIKMKIAYAGPIGYALSCMLKTYAIIFSIKKIKKCIFLMESKWREIDNERDSEIMVKNTKNGINITILCGSLMYIGGISYEILMPFLPGNVMALSSNSTDRLLMYPVSRALVDSRSSPAYELLYCSHIIMGVFICTASVSACHLGATFITHLCAQIEIIILRLDMLTDDSNGNTHSLHNQIQIVIDLHNKAINFAAHIEEILSKICLIEMITSCATICLDEYYCLLSLSHNKIFGLTIYSVLLISFCFNVFIFCYIGELLNDQYTNVGTAVYATNWHNFSHREVRALMLILLLTQHSQKITAGGIMELSFSGFTTVIRASVTCLNLIRMVIFS